MTIIIERKKIIIVCSKLTTRAPRTVRLTISFWPGPARTTTTTAGCWRPPTTWTGRSAGTGICRPWPALRSDLSSWWSPRPATTTPRRSSCSRPPRTDVVLRRWISWPSPPPLPDRSLSPLPRASCPRPAPGAACRARRSPRSGPRLAAGPKALAPTPTATACVYARCRRTSTRLRRSATKTTVPPGWPPVYSLRRTPTGAVAAIPVFLRLQRKMLILTYALNYKNPKNRQRFTLFWQIRKLSSYLQCATTTESIVNKITK